MQTGQRKRRHSISPPTLIDWILDRCRDVNTCCARGTLNKRLIPIYCSTTDCHLNGCSFDSWRPAYLLCSVECSDGECCLIFDLHQFYWIPLSRTQLPKLQTNLQNWECFKNEFFSTWSAKSDLCLWWVAAIRPNCVKHYNRMKNIPHMCWWNETSFLFLIFFIGSNGSIFIPWLIRNLLGTGMLFWFHH